MPIKHFEELFLKRSSSLKLSVANTDLLYDSRIGGYAPLYFDDNKISEYRLNQYWYFFTIGKDIFRVADEKEISVFIPKEFNIYNKNYKYPDFPIQCILHPSTERGNNEHLYHPQIKSKQIISLGVTADFEEIEDVDNPTETIIEPVFGSKIGGNPALLQKDDSYYSELIKNGYVFLMQFDESSYQKGQIIGNDPFNHGIVYFYGKFENESLIDFIAGFWQN
jgi:hypothetical protein